MRILQSKAVLLVDLSNVVARAVSVAPDRYLGLLINMLAKLRRQYPHHEMVYALEGSGTLIRQRTLPEYKAGRIPSPEFNDARTRAIKMLKLTACRLIKAPDGEADDAIATYCHEHPNETCVIVSNDRDLWQLINSRVTVHATVKRSTTDVDRHACQRLLGVQPNEIPLMKAILGDPSDQIPRAVERVHKKKLLRLVQETKGDVGRLAEVVSTAEYLTGKDKEKVKASVSTVKRHVEVTRARLGQLKQRQYQGDATRLKKFLAQYGDQVDNEDIRLVT